MLNVKYCLKLGQDSFEITGDFKNEKEFFQQMSFFSNLPKTAPNGATDLKLVVRETKKGTYYSLVSEQEKMEFEIGQHKEGDTLYAKGWVPLYQKETDGQTQGAAAPAFGAQTTQKAAPAQTAAPAFGTQQQAAPAAAPAQTAAAPAFGTQAPAPAQPAAPAAAPAATAPAPAPAAPAVSPQVQATANNVLSRFGIGPK